MTTKENNRLYWDQYGEEIEKAVQETWRDETTKNMRMEELLDQLYKSHCRYEAATFFSLGIIDVSDLFQLYFDISNSSRPDGWRYEHSEDGCVPTMEVKTI